MSKFSINSKKFSINDENSSSNSSNRVKNNTRESTPNHPNILGNIIRRIEPLNTIVDEENEKLIVIDDKTGKIQSQDNFFIRARTFMGRSYSHYVVNWTEFSKVDRLTSKISNPKDGTTIELDMSFELSFVEKREEDILRFFKNNISSSRISLEKAIANWTRSFISQNPNFIDSFFGLESKLKDYISRQASRNIGVLIQNIHFKPIGDPDEDFPPEHLTIVHSSNCEIFDDHLDVKNKIVVNLINKRAFLWRGIEDPEAWIKQKTDTIIQNQLIDKSFRNIVNEFDSNFEKAISEELKIAVSEIGYSIKSIISVPSNEIAEFLEMFTFNLEGDDTFETAAAEIKVKLGITIETKGTELNEIDDKYIKPRKSIIEEVRKQTIQVVGTTLRQTDPEEYYSNFNNVRASLEAKIKENLFQNFKLDEENFIISTSFLNTDLKERYDLLFSERGIVELESNAKDVYYKVKFRVKGVNDWYVFHKNHLKYYKNTELEYQDISKYLKSEIELKVRRYSSSDIRSMDVGELDRGIINLFINAQSVVTEEFGLELDTPRLNRVFGGDIINTSGIIASANKEKIKLLSKRLEEAILSGDEDLVDEIKQKLNETTTENKAISNSSNKLFEKNKEINVKRIESNTDEQE
jgi:hypothetical protein